MNKLPSQAEINREIKSAMTPERLAARRLEELADLNPDKVRRMYAPRTPTWFPDTNPRKAVRDIIYGLYEDPVAPEVDAKQLQRYLRAERVRWTEDMEEHLEQIGEGLDNLLRDWR